MLTGILHSNDGMCPVIWILGRPIGSYGLCMVLSFACIGVTGAVRGRRIGIRWEDAVFCGAFALGLGLTCGNLLYLAVTYSPGAIFDRLAKGDWQIFQEGFVFYGGMAGGFAGAVLGAAVIRSRASLFLEAVLPALPFAHGIGRIGCFLAGCCHGMPYAGPLALRDSLTGETRFPVQLLEAAATFAIGVYLIHLVKQKRHLSELLYAYLGLYSTARFLLEYLRGDGIRGAFMGLSTSQWISVGVFTLCALRLLYRNQGR